MPRVLTSMCFIANMLNNALKPFLNLLTSKGLKYNSKKTIK